MDAHIAEVLGIDLANEEDRALDRSVRWYQRLIVELVAIRQDAGLTQTEVARRMGCSQPAVSNFERVGGDPHLSTVARYAAALGVSIQNRYVVDGAKDSEERVIRFRPHSASEEEDTLYFGHRQAR